MKLVMTLKVRDEEDVLDANLRFHLAQGVDFVVALDNGSVDSTPEILGRYRDAGLAHVIERPTRTFGAEQGDWVTEVARVAASEFGADWVINNDADEFWWPVAGTLRDAFAGVPEAYGALAAPRPEFLPRLEEDGGDFAQRLVIRERRARNIPKLAHRGSPDVVVGQGSHRVRLAGAGGEGAGRTGARAADQPYSRPPEHHPLLPAARWPVRILHFPFRSYAQFVRRVERFALSDNGYPDLSRRRELREVERRGELPDLWRNLVPSDAVVEEGLRDGRFVRDTGLRDFLAGCPDPVQDGLVAARAHAERHAAEMPAEVREAELADLALSMMEAQARNEKRLVRRRRRTRERLEEARRRASQAERRAAELERRLAEAGLGDPGSERP